jgi:hypothetical protein
MWQVCLGGADVALAPYVVTVTVKARTREEMLTGRSQLLCNLSRGYAKPFDKQFSGVATGYYIRAYLENISVNLHGRHLTHPSS